MIQWGKVTQFFSYVRLFFQAKALGALFVARGLNLCEKNNGRRITRKAFSYICGVSKKNKY